jgi:uncharacterized protein
MLLDDLAELIRPTRRIRILKDEPDNRILECTIFGNASIIVTGDLDLLRVGQFQGIRILTLREYLDF